MKKSILIPILVFISCLLQSCEHEKATVIPAKQYDINLIVGNYKWSRKIRSWSGFRDTTFTVSDTTFPILYKNDSAVTTLNYELKIRSIDSFYNLYTQIQSSGYGANIRYSPTKKIVYLYYQTGGLGGGTQYNYTGTKIN